MAKENLEDLNRQLAEAQERATKAEEYYTHTREQLSKIGENYYKTTMLTVEEQKNVIKEYKKLKETVKKEDERRNILNKALDEQTKIEKKKVEKAKKEVSEIEKRIAEANKPSIWQNLITKLSGGSSDNSFEEMYRVRQRFSGISQIFSGNITSGISDVAGSFKGIANIMKGPYFLAITGVTKGLLKLDNALAKAAQSAIMMSGGLDSQFMTENRWIASAFNKDIKSDLYNIGMQGEYENIKNAMTKGYGMATYQGQQRDFINSMAYAQKGLGAYGISADASNTLLSNLRLLEGKNTTGIYAQLERLSKTVASMKYFSPDQAMQQMASLFDQTKMLGTNFEWTNRAIRQFERGLKEGTISISDFAAVNRGLRSGGISKNAGIAEMVVDFAARSGLNLPPELLASDPMGRGLALSTKSILSNNQFALAYQGWIQEQIGQMGGATKQDKAARLQTFLSALNVNIGPEMAEKAIKSDGTIDLIGTKILGTGITENEKIEKERAEAYRNKVELYYSASTSWHTQVLNNLAKIVNNTGSGFDKGMSGEVSSEEKTSEMIGYIIRYWGQALGIVDKDKNAPINPTRLS